MTHIATPAGYFSSFPNETHQRQGNAAGVTGLTCDVSGNGKFGRYRSL